MSNASQNHHQSPGQAYFDVLEKELSRSESEDDAAITWRGDPHETGADAAIVVVTNELKTTTYYVHKSMLCFGKKQSKYLANVLIKSARKKTSSKGRVDEHDKMPCVKVELNQRDADNVPIFLDFVYSQCSTSGRMGRGGDAIPENGTMDTVSTAGTSFSSLSRVMKSSSTESDGSGDDAFVEGGEITTSNAVSLRHLARKFENDALTRAVNKFIQKDLSFKTGPTYLYKAWEYKDERLMDSAQRLCAENIEQIDKKALVRLPLNLFRVVIKSLESFEEENKELSLYLSDVVCRYLEKHPKVRSAKLILELTDPILMPYIASEAAIGYTAIVKDLESDDAASHWNNLVQLCRRCAEAVVKEYGWSDFSVNAAVEEYLGKRKKDGPSNPHHNSLDSLLFATSFAAALEQAQDDYEEITMTHQQLSSVVEALTESASVMESVQQRKDEYIEQQRTALEKATEEIVKLRRQVNDLKQQQERQFQQQLQQRHMQQQRQQQEQEQHPQSPRYYSSPQKKRPQSPKYEEPRPPPSQPHPPRPPTVQQQPQQHQRSSPAPRSSPPPIARHRHPQEYSRKQNQQFGSPDSRPDLLEMKYSPGTRNAMSPATRDIVSPTQVGLNVHENKNRARQELRTKSEMRARSLLV